ncbi:hypothetical protein C5N14_08830 [Micromonospora sp. MW-13]|nr:hypothetical protein C5N14_08830 [Micromonospora sp. MW-13]
MEPVARRENERAVARPAPAGDDDPSPAGPVDQAGGR